MLHWLLGPACEDEQGTESTCDAACTDLCDCPQGLMCVSGQCIAGVRPVYCCDNLGCPGGEACTDQNGGSGMCCDSDCDCINEPTNTMCENTSGLCVAPVASAPRRYCCDSPDCPAGRPCVDSNGQMGNCGLAACTVDCDCIQGQICANGACLVGIIRRFCCDKVGCPTSSQMACTTNTDCTGREICDQGVCGTYCTDTLGNDGICP